MLSCVLSVAAWGALPATGAIRRTRRSPAAAAAAEESWRLRLRRSAGRHNGHRFISLPLQGEGGVTETDPTDYGRAQQCALVHPRRSALSAQSAVGSFSPRAREPIRGPTLAA